MELCFGLTTINNTAKDFLLATNGYTVYAFHGNMGTGKTTFIHALCETLGVKDVISSPTFSIINQYETKTGESIYHIDLYRLKNEQEAILTGVEECLYSGKICFVEWPDIAPGIFPDTTLHIHISVIGEEMRKIEW